MPQTEKAEIRDHYSPPEKETYRMTAGPVVSQTGDLGSGGGLQSHQVQQLATSNKDPFISLLFIDKVISYRSLLMMKKSNSL